MDRAERNNQRTGDLALLDSLIDSRVLTMTEKRRFRKLRDDVSSDIVNHYVLTKEEREEIRRYLHSPEEIEKDVNRTESVVERVYRIRHDQDRGYHGYHGHKKEIRNTMAEWAVYLFRTAALPAGLNMSEFRNLMLDTAAVAVAAAEWAEKKLGEKLSPDE